MRTGTAGFSQPPFGLGSFTALKLTNISASQGVRGPQGFNFSAAGVSAAQEKVERDKWKAALEFYNETGVMDELRAKANERIRGIEYNVTTGYVRFGRAPYNSP